MKPKLLLAEDHPGMRAIATDLLKRDFEVIASVSNGQAALEAAIEFIPDILILDVSMPILNGPEIARHLKLQGSKAKIVFLSVSRDIDQITACLAAGGDAYVFKSRMGTELFHAITEVLAGRTYVSPEVAELFGQKPGDG